MKTTPAVRKSLLSSTGMAAAAAVLSLSAVPALADCPAPSGQSCYWGGTGTVGTPAPSSGAPDNGDGHNGGGGGPGPGGSLSEDGLNWVGVNLQGILIAPLDLFSIGGAGAQGSDATAGLDGKNGGSGGNGGDGGDFNITMGSGMSGTTTATYMTAISITTTGGAGGDGAFGNLGEDTTNGIGGLGGNGGTLTLDLDGQWPGNINNQARAAWITSTGGAGGGGRDWKAGLNEDGPWANTGGAGGNITAIFRGTFLGDTGGVYVASIGGVGGNGGKAEDWPGSDGGNGGDGGIGQTVTITTTSTATLATFMQADAALHAVSTGGAGGQGGEGPSGGMAGAGGAAGNVIVNLQGGKFEAYGESITPGLLAQSLGGNGGDGGAASHGVIGPNGGAGNVGGTAGTVTVTSTAPSAVNIVTGMAPDINTNATTWAYSPGILAQSVGGGGGGGGDAKGWFAVGGDGGNGVDGNTASVDVMADIITWGTNSDGIAVQSIGGGGGKGADAQGSGVEVNMIIGGTGGGGGNGGLASGRVQQGSAIETNGSHGHGILIQSVGGGGGSGGAAYSKSTNLLYGASISLGGSGGNGGNGSTVGFVSGADTTNAGRIYTTGSDSFGILGQSIGGGGGTGGASTAISKTYSDDGYPGLSLALTMGGSGGNGGSAGGVTLDNSGLILSTGAGSVGILSQAVGGGGGAGGDASGSSTASGGEVNFSATFTFGGKSGDDLGTKNNGGTGDITNRGLIITTGESADGMLVQSIGGGGGAGGAGDSKASSSGGKDISGSLTMGGTGGNGGDGFSVTAMNAGSIITLGDAAFGVAAQSIGGGGGRGGGAAGSTSGDYTGTVSLGATGGAGGDTTHRDGNGNETTIVTVNNQAGATIVTFGGDANAIIAQSIGGGGGNAGKAGTNLSTKKSTGDGGNGDASGTPNTLSGMSQAFDANGMAGLSQYAGLNGAINAVNSLLGNSSPTLLGDDDADAALDEASQSKGETDDDNESTSITLGAAVGGKAGKGGSAGAVLITNQGEVATMGHHADAIVAMAVGGGGGKGGAASTAASDDNKSGDVAVGGGGGDGGWGGTATVNNSGDIYTKGALSAGILAQSIAGGGGIGGVSASSVSASSKNSGNSDANDGAFKSLNISVGGDGGGSWDSGQVIVNNSGAISTAAHDSIGIIAQSITGGGGVVKTLATDLEGAGGSASAKGTDYDINFKFGGKSGSTSQGSGYVNVSTTAGGTITTKGDNAYGILAQSISGGGGLALGGKAEGNSVAAFFGTGTTSGSVIDDGKNDPTNPTANSGLFVNVGANISTGFKQADGTVTGKGASAVIAQSIGGGGGLAGDTGWTQQHETFGGGGTNRTGNGGVVEVTISSGVTISAIGDNTTAIIAQSIGGGGGYIANTSGLFTGTAGGHGYGNDVTVTNSGTITVTGAYAIGIFAQSDGDGSQHGRIAIDNYGTVNGSASNWAVYFDHGGTQTSNNNVLNNWGTINSGAANGYAVYGNAGYVYITNSGTIWGQIDLTDGGGSGYLDIIGSGFVHSSSINVGNNCSATTCGVSNAGTLDMRSASGMARITGDYVGKAGSTLVLAADFAAAKGTQLTIDGDAVIDGTVDVRASSMRNQPLTLINTTGTLTLATSLQSSGTHLFDYALATDGKLLKVTPRAHFAEQADGLGHNRQAVAGSLQSLFDSGASADAAFGRLMTVADGASYASALDSLAGGGLGAFGAFRFNSSRAFAANLYGGCNDLQFDSRSADRCGWARVLVNTATQDASTDTLGYKADSWAIQKGLQLPISSNLALTLSSAYENTTFRDGGVRIKGDSIVGGIGLFYAPARLELSGAIDAAYGWYRSSRSITLGGITEEADAKPRQSQVGGHVRAAYDLAAGSSSFVRPFVEGHVIRVSNKAFTETGSSPFRLAVEKQSDTALIGVAGVEFGTKLALSEKVSLRPFASGALEFGDRRDWTTTARFAEQPQGQSFDLTTAGPNTLGRFAIGADIIGAKNIAVSIQYAPEFGSGYASHAGTARFTLAF